MVGKSIKTFAINLPNDWGDGLNHQLDTQALFNFLQIQKKSHHILPRQGSWFKALTLTSLSNTKVVILGQDPYPNAHHAHGLCFSVPNDINLPASLNNIFKAIHHDIGVLPNNGNLTRWATQGILLLNTVLTVSQGQIGSHRNKGWETITDAIIQIISTQKQNVVFLLWGKDAQNKIKLIDTTKHLILTTSHPSPLSAYRGFLSCKHFSQTNTYLKQHYKTQISWL